MTVDPVVSLAVSVHSNKGVYALLLGSGVSRSAGIKTGWEVVLDLIKKVAVAGGEEAPSNPEAWYRARFGGEPDYSKLLDELTKSAADGTGLLRSYFEPSPPDAEKGLKKPRCSTERWRCFFPKTSQDCVLTSLRQRRPLMSFLRGFSGRGFSIPTDAWFEAIPPSPYSSRAPSMAECRVEFGVEGRPLALATLLAGQPESEVPGRSEFQRVQDLNLKQ